MKADAARGRRKVGKCSEGNISLRQAALQVFAEQGFAATGIRVLAEAADTSLSCIYLHFGGKEGLYNVIAEELLEELRIDVLELKTLAQGASHATRVHEVREMMKQLASFLLNPLSSTKVRFLAQDALFGNYSPSRLDRCVLVRLNRHLLEQFQSLLGPIDAEGEIAIATLSGQLSALGALSGLNDTASYTSGKIAGISGTTAEFATTLIDQALFHVLARKSAGEHDQKGVSERTHC